MFRRVSTILLSSVLCVGLSLPSTAQSLSLAESQPLAKKTCGKKKQKAKKGKRKAKAKSKKRRCKPKADDDVRRGYHPRGWLFWRTSADVDLHVFDALGNHSSTANRFGIENAVHGFDGLAGAGIDTGPNETFMERIPMTTRTFYYYACLDSAAPGPTTVESLISDSENSTRHIPHFVLTNDGEEFAVGRSPAFAPDPSFPVPPLCP